MRNDKCSGFYPRILWLEPARHNFWEIVIVNSSSQLTNRQNIVSIVLYLFFSCLLCHQTNIYVLQHLCMCNHIDHLLVQMSCALWNRSPHGCSLNFTITQADFYLFIFLALSNPENIFLTFIYFWQFISSM